MENRPRVSGEFRSSFFLSSGRDGALVAFSLLDHSRERGEEIACRSIRDGSRRASQRPKVPNGVELDIESAN